MITREDADRAIEDTRLSELAHAIDSDSCKRFKNIKRVLQFAKEWTGGEERNNVEGLVSFPTTHGPYKILIKRGG